MAKYYLVQYIHRADGCWVSPPECEDVWKDGCFKQVRFDNASGVGLVKCLGGEVLDPKVATEIDPKTGERYGWLPRPKKANGKPGCNGVKSPRPGGQARSRLLIPGSMPLTAPKRRPFQLNRWPGP